MLTDFAADYCEENLLLLITIMERSEDPITRSNAVIALGDMVRYHAWIPTSIISNRFRPCVSTI